MEEQNDLEKRIQEWKDKAEKFEKAYKSLNGKYHLLLEIADRIEEIGALDYDEEYKRRLYYGTNMND